MPAADFAIKGRARLDDSGLAEHIERFSRATGKGLLETARGAMKSLVRYALNYTPPASGDTRGKKAQRSGDVKIQYDLNRMGFVPVEIKGYRMLDHVFKTKLQTPIRIKTKLNPKFSNPEGHRRERLLRKHGGNITRGGSQAFYVDQRWYRRKLPDLFKKVGLLASGWALAADKLGVTVPSWIRRHARAGRGTELREEVSGTRVKLWVINHFPPGTEDIGRDVERRIGIFTQYVKNGLARQLKAFYAGKWKETAR